MKLLLAIAAVSALDAGALTTDASAHGYGASRHRHTVYSYQPHVSYYQPGTFGAPNSCYRGQWVGGPKWRRYRRMYVCG